MKVIVTIETEEFVAGKNDSVQIRPVRRHATFQEDEPISNILAWVNGTGAKWEDIDVCLYLEDMERSILVDADDLDDLLKHREDNVE